MANETIAPEKNALSELHRYAKATRTKVVTSVTDLNIKDRAMGNMLEWCKSHKDIVVLNSGSILSSHPTSRNIQNCKSVLLKKGLYPGKVFAATNSLITLLLENATEKSSESQPLVADHITDRQQHLRNLVNEAITKNISDIHIEVRASITKVRMRQHGELQLYAEWSAKLGREIAAVAFNKETDHATSHFNPLVPQDASMPLVIYGKKVRLRLASVPAHDGFDMVMRILATDQKEETTLAQLGYTPTQIKLINNAIHYPNGAIIVAGPTGSGKTTTLAACMKMVSNIRKIYSIEDPVEKLVKQATQVPVNTDKDDRSFASMGRAALRMDPDVIVLGEMRDEDTTHVMIRAAITGHLVLTTVHTNSATGIIPRLIDMGISPVLLSDNNVLRLLIFQRLVVKLCPHCAAPIQDSPAHEPHLARWEAVIGDLSQIKVRGEGCQTCGNTAVLGRTVIAEIVWIDDKGRNYIQQGDTLNWEKYLREQSWESYSDHGIQLLRQGITDPLDLEKVIGRISIKTKNDSFDYATVQ